MAGSNNNWYFTKEQLESSPSRENGIEGDKELSYRQQAANFIQDMGQKLRVSQLCINTAIVYMHRFYVFHSFTNFPWYSIAAAALFLAAKVEEQPRKLEHVIRVANHCKNPRDTVFDTTSERYQTQSQDLVFNENILLQTLGFDVAIDHPHTYVVKCCHLVKASKELAQTSYFIASNSLHLTTMCLQYKPTVVACFCIHLVCKWSNWEIPLSNEKKQWFSYVDSTVTIELLQQLTGEYLIIYEKCPSRLKERILSIGGEGGSSLSHGHSSPLDQSDKNLAGFLQDTHQYHSHRNYREPKPDDSHKARPPRHPHEAGSSNQQHRDRERESREKKERERLAYHSKTGTVPNAVNKHLPQSHGHHGNHSLSMDAKAKLHARPPSMSHPPNPRLDPRDVLREAAKERERDNHRDPHRDPSKDLNHGDKREHSFTKPETKSNSSDSNSVVGVSDVVHVRPSHSDKRVDPSRPKPPDVKLQQKHDSSRSKPYNAKLETDIKKHLSAAIQEKNSVHLQKFQNSTSQKIKPPFPLDASKSVPTNEHSSVNLKQIKLESHNGTGSNGSTYNLPLLEAEIKPKIEHLKQEVKEKELPMLPIKKPSLFSPEKSPPHKKAFRAKSPLMTIKQEVLDNFLEPIEPISPFGSPQCDLTKRNRTSSNSSEAELRPVMKKIDQVQGFENIMRDASIGIKLDTSTKPTIKTELTSTKDIKPPDVNVSIATSLSQPIVNGMETNPMLISSLLKEAPPVHLVPSMATSTLEIKEEKEHHHKKSKKDKHKHKDKDKSKEEKEKKKKHKEKDKEKHKHKHRKYEVESEIVPAQPIKITIPKDKIQPPDNPPSIGLKIKIPKDRIKTESIGEPSAVVPSGGLKIKISKEVISNYTPEVSSRKREREKTSPSGGPSNKLPKVNYNSKPSMKNSYNRQVAQLGDGGTSIHRLAESKYNSRGTTS